MSFFEVALVFLVLYVIFNKKFRMSLIDNYKSLNTWEKSVAGTFVFLTIFWIFSFYLFKPNILQYQWYIILTIALALSIIFYLLNAVNVFLQLDLIYKDNSKGAYIFSSFFQPVAELVIIIAITYFFNWSFKTMVIIALGINAFRCLLLVLATIFLTKTHK
jgi:hypothetical protein